MPGIDLCTNDNCDLITSPSLDCLCEKWANEQIV